MHMFKMRRTCDESLEDARRSPDHGAVGRGGVRAKKDPSLSYLPVEFIPDHARLDTHPSFLCIDLKDAVKMFRYINNYPIAYALTGKGSARRARDQGSLMVTGKTYQYLDIVLAVRITDSKR